MRIKSVPEDFVVRELAEWTPVERGPVSVYEVTKRKLDTFEAMRLLAAANGLPLQSLTYVGLKDRQGLTTQLVSVSPGALRNQVRSAQGLRWRYLGRTAEPLGPDNLRGNAFELVVRDLDDADVATIQRRAPMVARHGVTNYFDDQRFGSLVQGQGLPGRDLVKGDFEAVVRALLTAPGHRDPVTEKKWKKLVGHLWGQWDELARKWGERRGLSIVRHLRSKPGDFAGALQRMPAKERAIHVFAYQSWVWNRSVARYLEAVVPKRWLARSRHVSGELVWVEAPADQPVQLVESFPLLDHRVEVADPAARAAIDEVLAGEGLTRETFRIEGIRGCFFKHHERPLMIRPAELEVSQGWDDEQRPGRKKLHIAFSLPPGAYATLVLERLLGRAVDQTGGRDERRARGGEAEPADGRRARHPLEEGEPAEPDGDAPAGERAPRAHPRRGGHGDGGGRGRQGGGQGGRGGRGEGRGGSPGGRGRSGRHGDGGQDGGSRGRGRGRGR